ncbi:MAG: hypothetical protein CFE45_24635, partial [Burkholderiales bacterium PBB5]
MPALSTARPTRVALLGAGHIGQTIAGLLAGCGDYHVTVVDRSATALARLLAANAAAAAASPATIRTLQADTEHAAA